MDDDDDNDDEQNLNDCTFAVIPCRYAVYGLGIHDILESPSESADLITAPITARHSPV